MLLHDPNLDGRISDAEVLGAFDTLTPWLADFAEQHSLFVRKYLHNQPMWSFYFKHPLGGTGMLQLTIGRDQSKVLQASTAGAWYVDDDDAHLRSTSWVPVNNLSSLQQEHVIDQLADVLTRLLEAPESSRNQVNQIAERRTDHLGERIYSSFERSLREPT